MKRYETPENPLFSIPKSGASVPISSVDADAAEPSTEGARLLMHEDRGKTLSTLGAVNATMG